MSIRGGNAISDIKEGFGYIRKEPTILTLLAFTLFMVVLSMPYMTLLPIFSLDILKVGASGMGVLVSVSGAGAMTGSLVIASLPNKKRGLMLLFSGLILGLALTAFAFSHSWLLSLIIIVFVGLGQAGRMALGNTLIQYYVDDEYRGRVLSVYVMQFGLTSFGGAGAGLLAEGVGAPWALGGFSISLVVTALAALVFLPRIRKLD
jgi:MFS family permease